MLLVFVLLSSAGGILTAGFAMPAVGAVSAIGVVVLLLNVLGPSYRPRLARAADALGVVVLLAILPLAAIVCGVL